MIMPCGSGSARSRLRRERTASERQHPAMTAAADLTPVRPRTPGTLGIPGDQARLPQVRPGAPY
jgi:hypothetical protein